MIYDFLLLLALMGGYIVAATAASVCVLAAWFKVCEVARGR